MDSINVAIFLLKPLSHRIKNMINFFWSKTQVATRRKCFFYKFTNSFKEGIVLDD